MVNVSKLYVDDPKLFSEMVTEESALNLQRDLEFACKRTQYWLNRFNINKFMLMHYGHNNEKRHFFIDYKQLDESDSERDMKRKNQVLTATILTAN